MDKPVQLVVGYGFKKENFSIEITSKDQIIITGIRPEGSDQMDMGFKAEIGFKCKRRLMACDLELNYEGDTVWVDIRGQEPAMIYKYSGHSLRMIGFKVVGLKLILKL